MEEDYMPTDIQYKDELRKDKIKVEEQIELIKNKEYDRLLKKLEKDLTRINESLQD